MTIVLTRPELHALVWERPMSKLAAEFGLSSTALQALCRRNEVPTPPCGHWMKKAHGKPVRVTPLPPRPSDGTGADRIAIHPGMGLVASLAVAACDAVRAGTEPVTASATEPRDRLVATTLAKLAKAKLDSQGFGERPRRQRDPGHGSSRLGGSGRLGARRVGARRQEPWRHPRRPGESAQFVAEEETVTVELVEVADTVARTATPAELQALALWEAKQEADRERYGHVWGWGRPRIPKWEDRHQGHLAVRLEEVRVRLDSPWGPALRRTYADHGRRTLEAMVVAIVAAATALAITKRENRDADDRRHREAEEWARRWAEAERRAALDELVAEQSIRQRERYVTTLNVALAGAEVPPRVGRFATWARARLDRMKARRRRPPSRRVSRTTMCSPRTRDVVRGCPSPSCGASPTPRHSPKEPRLPVGREAGDWRPRLWKRVRFWYSLAR